MAIVGGAFARRPMFADVAGHLCGRPLLHAQTADVVAELALLLHDLASAQRLTLALHGDHLPAAAEAGLFRTQADALGLPALQSSVFLAPARVVLGAKKISGSRA